MTTHGLVPTPSTHIVLGKVETKRKTTAQKRVAPKKSTGSNVKKANARFERESQDEEEDDCALERRSKRRVVDHPGAILAPAH